MTENFIIGTLADRQRMIDRIVQLDLDKRWEITVKRHRKRRSNAQGRLYFGWVEEVVKHVVEYTGYEKDEIHDHLKNSFLEPGREIQIKGLPDRRRSPTTTALDTKEMSEYCNRIYRWASVELGLALRLPPERGYDSDGRPALPEQAEQANGADDDWLTLVLDLEAAITRAESAGTLDEITANYQDELDSMEANSPDSYTRVMRAMENRGQELDDPPAKDLHPLQAG